MNIFDELKLWKNKLFFNNKDICEMLKNDVDDLNSKYDDYIIK